MDEMERVVRFAQANETGRAAYKALRQTSGGQFPQYAEELRGIADGSGVPLSR